MNALRRFAILPLLALAALGVAGWTGDVSLGESAAGISALLAGAYLVLVVADRRPWGWRVPPRYEGDPLVLLERSFRGGRYGRQSILARVDGLEGVSSPNATIRADEEAAALDAPEDRFLDYLEARVADLERRT